MAEFVKAADATEVAEGTLEAFDAGGVRVPVANLGGTFHAFDTCTNLQCSLADGDLLRSPRRNRCEATPLASRTTLSR